MEAAQWCGPAGQFLDSYKPQNHKGIDLELAAALGVCALWYLSLHPDTPQHLFVMTHWSNWTQQGAELDAHRAFTHCSFGQGFEYRKAKTSIGF